MKQDKNKRRKLHIKVGDKVQAIAGNSKGRIGKVLSIDRLKLRAVVEGLNMVTKHMKPSANNPDGEIRSIEGTIHVSNLMLIDPAINKPRRTKMVIGEDGKKSRVFKTHTSLQNNDNN
ncbi:MAG: 50S ribosomal protein L24 [Microscillaceae bacterium]